MSSGLSRCSIPRSAPPMTPGAGSGAESPGQIQPVFPREQPSPIRPRSKTVTSAPPRVSANAHESPTTPPPTTATRTYSVAGEAVRLNLLFRDAGLEERCFDCLRHPWRASDHEMERRQFAAEHIFEHF